MPWCPKCRRFQEEDDLCIHCWVEPVDELPPEVEPDTEVYLVTVTNENEANLIQSLLEANGIPTLHNHRESGQFLQVYMGMSSFGIDLFVPERQLSKAKELLEGHLADLTKNSEYLDENGEDFESEWDNIEFEDEIRYDTTRRRIGRMLLGVYLVPTVLGVIIAALLSLYTIWKYYTELN